MGPSRTRDQNEAQDDVRGVKDDRVATLEARLEAYSARASTAHVRLLKTIDTLDALRSQHALEISTEERAKMKLVHEVDRWRSMAKSLEVEKDELKDVVEDLIQKVGCTLRNMQRGNLNVDFPEQAAPSATDGGGAKDHHDHDLLAYATSIIARLRTELDLERRSHCKTVEEANLRIEELEAKVAVREAELERCITAGGNQEYQPGEPADGSVPTYVSEKRILGEKLPKPKPLSDEECLRFLQSNSARNRSLELEIRLIADKLEHARMASASSGSPKEARSLTPRNGRQAHAIPSPRTRSASVDPNVLSRALEGGKTASALALASPSTMPSIAQLDDQIHTMTSHMDALMSERTTLIEAATRRRRVTEEINLDSFPDVLRVEEECVRLQSEVDNLREQLQHARWFAREREKALLREIAQLRASSGTSSASRPAHEMHHLFSPQPLEDDIATEESMELASPLMPTIVPNIPFPVSPHYSLSAEADANLVTFTLSPRHMSSPAPQSPPNLAHTASRRTLGAQEIERVQAALDTARTHLAQKEDALVQLSAEVERLQLRAETQARNDGG